MHPNMVFHYVNDGRGMQFSVLDEELARTNVITWRYQKKSA
jgi:hypothetical protein